MKYGRPIRLKIAYMESQFILYKGIIVRRHQTLFVYPLKILSRRKNEYFLYRIGFFFFTDGDRQWKMGYLIRLKIAYVVKGGMQSIIYNSSGRSTCLSTGRKFQR